MSKLVLRISASMGCLVCAGGLWVVFGVPPSLVPSSDPVIFGLGLVVALAFLLNFIWGLSIVYRGEVD